jgi:hypothetical protein
LNGCSLKERQLPKECVHIYLFIYFKYPQSSNYSCLFGFFFFSSKWVGGVALGEWDRIGGVVVKNKKFLTFFQRKVWKPIFWVLGFTKLYPLWIRLNLGPAPQGSYITFIFFSDRPCWPPNTTGSALLVREALQCY